MCIVSNCGTRSLEAGEECDDGNHDAGDGCSPDCHLEGTPTSACPGTAIRLGSGGQAYTGSTTAAGLTNMSSCAAGIPGGASADRVYQVTAVTGGMLTISLQPTSMVYDPVLIIRSSCTIGMGPDTACVNAMPVGTTEVHSLPVTAGSTTTVIIDGAAGTAGTYNLVFILS
jgi:cysteine-rich repeat protein